tara:strand:- start:11770 stop:13575 length:1806 start_codon:yes stop_codon:yes gene_type:complete
MSEEDNNKDINAGKIISQFRRLWTFLSNRRKNQLIILLLIEIFSALLATTPIYLIGPITEVISNQKVDNYFVNQFKFQTFIDPVFFLVVFVFMVISSSLLKLLTIYLRTRISALVGNDISNTIFLKTLSQPYNLQLQRNSSEIIAGLGIQLNMVVANLFRFFQFISSGINSLFIFTTLILLEWKINLFILVAILLLYFSIAIYTRKKLSGNSRLIANMINMHIKEIKESLGSIKDIIVYNSQKYFRDRFNNIDRKLRFAKAENLFLAFGPRYLIEALGISLLILIILLFKVSNTEYKIIPLLATLAFGSQKLLSEIQMGYQAWAKFYSVGRTFDIILNLISQQYINPAVSNSFKTIKSFNNIVLENVCFGFQKNDKYLEIISDLNFSIKKGDRIGVVGKTGTGKTTLGNLIMGLYKPTFGKILINNKNIYDVNNRQLLFEWRSLISYVPQDPFLLDKSIAENIAFGISKNEIDFEKVKDAAKKASISNFIDKLPDNYHTIVGENGAILSGGQKQRIAIARAFFRNAKFILFDESTSALDKDTEFDILNTIYKLDKEVTLILLAHRLSTLKECSRVIELKEDSTFEVTETKEFFNKIKNTNI